MEFCQLGKRSYIFFFAVKQEHKRPQIVREEALSPSNFPALGSNASSQAMPAACLSKAAVPAMNGPNISQDKDAAPKQLNPVPSQMQANGKLAMLCLLYQSS